MAKKAVRRPRRVSREKKSKKNNTRFPLPKIPQQQFIFGGPIFNIFPSNYPSPQLNIYMSMMSMSIKHRLEFIKTIRKQLSKFSTPAIIPALPASLPWGSRLASAIQITYTKLIRMRARFRKFLHHWRVNRLKLASEEDLVTCEVPVHPITVVDWNTKTKYTFEASTLMRDITNRLLTHDGFFDTPQSPRNPFTNEPFTLAQMVSLWNQLSRSPEPASWAFTCFASSQFNLKTFSTDYTIPLQLNALRVTMLDPTDLDQQDRLLDFIEYEHDLAGVRFYRNTYNHAILHHQDLLRMVSWRTLCTEFYEAHIKFQHNQAIMKHIHAQIHLKSQEFLTKPTELLEIYRAAALAAPPPPPPNPLEEEEAVIGLDIITFFNTMNMMNTASLLEAVLPPLPPLPLPLPSPPAPVQPTMTADDVSDAIELALATALSLLPANPTEDNTHG
jgi:hypothetical protein